MKKELLEWAKSFLIAIILVLVFKFFFATTVVYSTSMYPTLVEKDVLFLQKTHDLHRGDIVSFKSRLTLTEQDINTLNFFQRLFVNEKTNKTLIKRVIGLPGDSITLHDGVLTLNGVIMNEPYVSSENIGDVDIEKLPEGKYFMMGDNRAVSLDSRSDMVGQIDQKDIIGKCLFRVWPVEKFGQVK